MDDHVGESGSESSPSGREATHADRARDVRLLESVIEGHDDGFCVLTAAGTVLAMNWTAADILGLDRSRVAGLAVEELAAQSDLAWSPAREALTRQEAVTTVRTLPDGRTLLVSARPVFSADHVLEDVVVTLRDVSNINRLLGRLEETAELSDSYRAELRTLALRDAQPGVVVARSPRMQAVRDKALQHARTDSPVLLFGETGTGKGVFARLIHQASPRSAGPFLEVNCDAIPEGLIESELFGYARGAFTGASSRGKVGLLELAHEGTLLLEKIGVLPLPAQASLLRFLESGEVWPVGGARSKRPDVRLIAATSWELGAMVAQERFRTELYQRLSALVIEMPPLRERREDIPWLVELILDQLERQLGRRSRLTREAIDHVTAYHFPGNIPELRSLIEGLVVASETDTIGVEQLPAGIAEAQATPGGAARSAGTLREMLEQAEAQILREALRRCGTQMAAARHLGVGQATVARKAKRYGLT